MSPRRTARNGNARSEHAADRHPPDQKLMPAEIEAARRAGYFGIEGWGDEGGLDPAGMVAKLRGVRFVRDAAGRRVPLPEHEYDAQCVMDEVAEWLGFESANAYLLTLKIESRAIFKRARY